MLLSPWTRACLARPPFRPSTTTIRRIHSAVTAPPRQEHFQVPCRSNGSINIDVFHAAKPSSPVLIYLPPGPVLSSCPEQQDRVISTLRASSAATLVCIGYRASSTHKYPTPYHDVLFGFDWIQENLLRDEFQRQYHARLGVCGEMIGGSIAAMLALTECRVGESRIGAVAVNSPIMDWVFPDHLPPVGASDLPEPISDDETAFPADEDMADSPASSIPAKVSKRKKQSPTKQSAKKQLKTSWHAQSDNAILSTALLCKQRDELFHKPDDYFDRFTSPIHFFRSPHAQMVAPVREDPAALSVQLDPTLDTEAQMSLNHFASFNSQAPEPLALPTLERCRSYARSYPQAGYKLSMPVWNITAGTNNPLQDQSAELSKVLRRSIARHTLKSRCGRTKWHDAAEKEGYEAYAEERVRLETPQGPALWSHQESNPNWQQELDKVGTWMKQNLQEGTP